MCILQFLILSSKLLDQIPFHRGLLFPVTGASCIDNETVSVNLLAAHRADGIQRPLEPRGAVMSRTLAIWLRIQLQQDLELRLCSEWV
jgi:hypothetical protein